MKDYLKFSLALSTFGFLKEFRPTEPFIVDYYTSEKNVTLEDVNQSIFPTSTYSYLTQLVIVFLITDYLRYKPLIVVSGLSSALVWLLMLFFNGKLQLQMIEIIYGTFCATEVAYYSYIYAKTDKKYYQQVTSHTRSAIFFGRLFASILAQILVYFSLVNYWQLNLITFICQVTAALWTIFFIPSVKTSIYFHRKKDVEGVEATGSAFALIWEHFRVSYTNMTVILWSIYYSISFCMYFQIFAYIQVLWLSIDDNAFWNGAVDSIYTCLAGVVALCAGKISITWLQSQTQTILVLILSTVLQGVIIFFAATSSNLVQCYIMFILYGGIYSLSITICATKIAENISEDSYGLVFGFNTFIALVIQTCLTLSVVSSGFMLSPSGQYIVYACIYFALGGVYLIKLLIDEWWIFYIFMFC